MDCDATSERLPWLMAGGLEASEAEQVRAHLGGCPRCRAEMEDTRRAAGVFGAHLAASALLDLAWDRPLDGIDPALAKRHLDACVDCDEELALLRESRRLESTPAEPVSAARRTWWPLIALPAGLAAGLVVGVWSGHRPSTLPGPDAETERLRASALESEVDRLRGVIASLRSQAPTVELPRLNLPVFEILPGDLVTRGASADGNAVVLPAGATEVVLLLSADAPAEAPASLTIQDAAGREAWRGDGLRFGPPGGYVVAVPAAMLPDGAYLLTVRPAHGAAIAYRIRVRHGR